MEIIELGPASQDGTPFNADETRDIWAAIDRASDQGETTILAISGQPAAVIGPAPPARPEPGLATSQDRQPAITRVSDAEIRVFPQEEGTDDASDMYVMEVLGTTVRVRLVREDDGDPDFPPRTLAKIMVEAGGVFIVGVNEDENVYGDAAGESWTE